MKTFACLMVLCTFPLHLCAEEIPPAVETLEDPGYEKFEDYWVLIRDEKSRVFFAKYQLTDKATAVFTLGSNVDTLKDGIAKINAKLPQDSQIVALAQLDGWFIYATKIICAKPDTAPSIYRVGYAVKRGTKDVIYWGSW